MFVFFRTTGICSDAEICLNIFRRLRRLYLGHYSKSISHICIPSISISNKYQGLFQGLDVTVE